VYFTSANPWQSSASIPQQFPQQFPQQYPQQYLAQSYLPVQQPLLVQGYSIPVQSGVTNIPQWGYNLPPGAANVSQWGYNLPPANAMFSPAAGMQTGMQTGIQGGILPQGNISYGFNPSFGWSSVSSIPISHVSQFNPQVMQQQYMQPGILSSGINTATGFAQPRVELAESNTDVIVTADLPNVDPNNIYITVTDDSLSISALALMGGTSSSLHRTVALPTNIKAEHIDISYTNGTLECRLPKSDFVARRRVKVNTTG